MDRKHKQGDKIADPVAHAERNGQGPFQVWLERDLWGEYAPHYTTLSRFGQVDGVRWYNNCGPTAVTNLLVMYRRKYGSGSGRPNRDLALYAKAARYGTRYLFYVNLEKGPVRGTSDLRAGLYLRRVFSRLLGVHPAIRMRPATEANLRQSLDGGALLYLLLRRHPAYRNHHLVGYGYTILRSETTGALRTYLKVSDGHAAAPRYLDLREIRGRLLAYYEVRFPENRGIPDKHS